MADGYKVCILEIKLEESGGLDSNQRPLAPHANALPGCATTRIFLFIFLVVQIRYSRFDRNTTT